MIASLSDGSAIVINFIWAFAIVTVVWIIYMTVRMNVKRGR